MTLACILGFIVVGVAGIAADPERRAHAMFGVGVVVLVLLAILAALGVR